MERRRNTTVRQMELLVEFLGGHRDLALGRVRSKEARAVAQRLWTECAEILNAEGPARTGKEWSKQWNDFKCRVRAKLVSINASRRATGGGPISQQALSNLEERVADIIGRDVGPLPDVQHNQFLQFDDNVQVEEIESQEPTQQEVISQLIVLPHDENNGCQTPTRTPHLPTPQEVFPTPSPRGATRVRERRRLSRRSSQHPTGSSQSARTHLDESRRMVLELEKMRAENMASLAGSFRLIAESIDRLSRKVCGENNPTS